VAEDGPHPLQWDDDDDDDDNVDDNDYGDFEGFWKCDNDQVEKDAEPKKTGLVSNLTKSLKNMALGKASLRAVSALERVERMNMSNVMAFERRGVATDEPRPAQIAQRAASPRPKALTTFNVQETLLSPHCRPREPRLNSAFYRIYAVESCMRKSGKFDQNFLGRAQLVCEPRRDGNQRVYLVDEEQEVFGIRKRFVSKFDRQVATTTPVDRTVPLRWHCTSADDLCE
jgi:hypothetical protein